MANDTTTDTNVTEAQSAELVNDTSKARPKQKKPASKTKVTEPASASTAAKGAAKPAKVPEKSAAVETKPAKNKRNKYTPAQRASILASIEKATKGGTITLKTALQQAEVSEQTYYNWKNAAAKTSPAPSTKSPSDDLTTLVALEAENIKLRKELAEKLRAENAELRKRLGKI
ncbi:transposase [Ochrobactrum sp. Marseille-Q0166]|uniref:transposase n=1 Tax=Ochrobactrum sp. Marseille-Q0166 TaxID=2761105 RepID=UPI00165547F7|nr:transposase [Ochrobactrum sp. Marseille-Q0166]MBC8719573.1 transposase [Ochrobactrum sp. Marseille-Q0166]